MPLNFRIFILFLKNFLMRALLHFHIPFLGFEIRGFCLTGHFLVWGKSHCSSPIATKLPCFSQLSLEALTHFSCKEVPDLCRKSTFPCTYFIPYFSQEISSSIVILFPTPLKSKSKQGWHFYKANIPRGYWMLSHTHPLPHTCTHTHTHTHYKIWSFWFISFWY